MPSISIPVILTVGQANISTNVTLPSSFSELRSTFTFASIVGTVDVLHQVSVDGGTTWRDFGAQPGITGPPSFTIIGKVSDVVPANALARTIVNPSAIMTLNSVDFVTA